MLNKVLVIHRVFRCSKLLFSKQKTGEFAARTFSMSRYSLASSQPPKSSSGTSSEFDELDKPIQYTTSEASKWTAERTHSGAMHPDVPEYQPFVVVFSVGMLLLYFAVLREENDMDEEMKKPLWEKIPGLEKQQILMLIKYNTEHNITTDALVERLKEIEIMEAKIKARKN